MILDGTFAFDCWHSLFLILTVLSFFGIQIYGFSWVVLVAIVMIFKVCIKKANPCVMPLSVLDVSETRTLYG